VFFCVEREKTSNPVRGFDKTRSVLDDGAKRGRPKGQKREKRAFLIIPFTRSKEKGPPQKFLCGHASPPLSFVVNFSFF
jgi:hypothetical protein